MKKIPQITQAQWVDILSSTSTLPPLWVEHFWKPLMLIRSKTEKTYRPESPPPRFSEARDFCDLLWEIDDTDSMVSLVSAYQEGASQFCFLLSLLLLERMTQPAELESGIEPISGKPFAALSFCARGWLDEVEAMNPGKTTRLPS